MNSKAIKDTLDQKLDGGRQALFDVGFRPHVQQTARGSKRMPRFLALPHLLCKALRRAAGLSGTL